MASTRANCRGYVRRLIRLFTAFTLLAVCGAVFAWIKSSPAAPDAFYRHAMPRDQIAGTLLRIEPYTQAVPPGARGWRILYVTTQGGRRVLASAVVVAPEQPQSVVPVVAWAHGTTGIADGCAPSLLDNPFAQVPDIAAIVREGWAYVGTDYPGLGTGGDHSYLVGADAAHAVLDSVRAARQLKDVSLGERTVVWGHSQGGNSALWTGILAMEIAPELKLVGIAALAPASDLKSLVMSSKGGMFGKIVSSYLVVAYAQAYPDVKLEDYVGIGSRLIVRDIASRCVSGYQTLFSVLETSLLPADGIFSRDPTAGPLGERLTENTPARTIHAPLLIAQGESDDLVLPEVQNRYVESRCSAGQRVDFRTYSGRDHVSLVASDSLLVRDLVQWSRDRFDDKPVLNSCR